MKNIIIFELKLLHFFSILFDFKNNYYYFPEGKKNFFLFNILKKKLKIINFATNEIFINKSNLHWYALKKANILTKKITDELISNDNLLSNLNNYLGKNTFSHYIQRLIYDDIRLVLIKINLVNKFVEKNNLIIINTFFPEIYNEVKFEMFQSKINFKRKNDLFLLLRIVKSYLKLIIFRVEKKKNNSNNLDKKNINILSGQEENIIKNFKIRGQPHFINHDEKLFKSYIINTKLGLKNYLENNKSIKIIDLENFRLIKNDKLNQSFLNKIHEIFRNNNPKVNLILKLRIIDLLIKSIFINNISEEKKIKLFLYQDNNINSSAANIISYFKKILTIQFQYSHLQIKTPVMVSNADYYFSFSKRYKDIFTSKEIKPKKILELGCLRENYISHLKDKNKEYRNRLKKNFVITFFDESILDNWGLLTKEDMKNYYKKIFKFLKKNSSFVFIFKSQFKHTSINKIFENDFDFKELMKENKIINLYESYDRINLGRNSVLTYEASLLSNLCISFKFSATAGLESAFLGKRTVLLDHKSFKSPFDKIYLSKEICFDNFDVLLKRIVQYKKNIENKKKDNLGNWDTIINNFSKNNYKNKNFGKKNIFREELKKIVK